MKEKGIERIDNLLRRHGVRRFDALVYEFRHASYDEECMKQCEEEGGSDEDCQSRCVAEELVDRLVIIPPDKHEHDYTVLWSEYAEDLLREVENEIEKFSDLYELRSWLIDKLGLELKEK